MTFITSSVTMRLSALFLAFVFVAALFSVAPASVAQASWDWADVGSGCCGAWDTGSNWDAGSGWDLGSNWDTGSDWDLGSNWDTGSGWDAGSNWDAGSGWDLGSNWDTGSNWDLGSNWDTGSGWDAGSNWDLGGGIAGYVTPEEGGIAGYVTPEGGVAGYVTPEGGVAGYVTPSRGYYSPGGYVHPATTPIRSIATARQNVANVVNRSNVENVRNIQSISRVNEVNRVNEINRINEQVRNVQTQVAAIQQAITVARPPVVVTPVPQPRPIPIVQQPQPIVRYAYPTPTTTIRPIVSTQPNITVASTGTQGYEYVNINSIPYTGSGDIAYILTLIATTLGSGAALFIYKGQILGVLSGLVPAFAFGHMNPTVLADEEEQRFTADDEMFATTTVQNDATETLHEHGDDTEGNKNENRATEGHVLSLHNGEDGPKLSFMRQS